MMKNVFVVLVVFLIVACSSKKVGNMQVTGKIEGLKKGTLYLEKMGDSTLVKVDSVKLLGKEDFLLTTNIDEPEVFFLTFDGNNTQRNILFFGEQGVININDSKEKFGINPKITGSKNQEILASYFKMNRKFQDKNLDIIKENIEAQKNNDKKGIEASVKKSNNLLKKQYLYTTNFALNHADTQVAPYIALTQLVNANIKLLDTINNSLSTSVKKSLYGKKLQNFVDRIKKEEK